jgi:TatD DNase family protein
VILHNRESFGDLLPLLTARSGSLRGVCHSFTEGPDEARSVVRAGLMVGISGMVTFKSAEKIRSMVAALEPHHVLVETDSPFLAPVPHRGRRNEPAFVVHVGAHIAEVWRVDLSSVARSTSTNFRRLFGLEAAWGEVTGQGSL